jgi:hypothetical protein
MRVFFSLPDVERLLSAEARARVGVDDDTDGVLFKTEVMLATSSPDFIQGGSDEVEYTIAIDVALPEKVADNTFQATDDVSANQRGVEARTTRSTSKRKARKKAK